MRKHLFGLIAGLGLMGALEASPPPPPVDTFKSDQDTKLNLPSPMPLEHLVTESKIVESRKRHGRGGRRHKLYPESFLKREPNLNRYTSETVGKRYAVAQ